MDSQKRLFAAIQSILPGHLNLADEISDVLSISRNASYQRIGGHVPLKLEEAEALCRHYRISLDEASGLESDTISFSYVPLSMDDGQEYLRYMRGMEASMQRLAGAQDGELKFAADDVPMFHFMPYPELTYFKLYAWNWAMDRTDASYERFVGSADRPELRDVFRGIEAAYHRVPTTEIWTEETIHPILNLLAHYRDFGKFDHPDTLARLCRQLLSILERVEHWAAHSRKDGEGGTPYSLYLCPVKPGSSIMLSCIDGKPLVRLKLYTINSIATYSRKLCDETQQWLDRTISKSTNLTRSSEIARTRFFEGMKAKVSALMP